MMGSMDFWIIGSSVTLVAGDERTIMAIVAPHRGETQSSEALGEGGEPT
jgi:hypothetical protein